MASTTSIWRRRACNALLAGVLTGLAGPGLLTAVPGLDGPEARAQATQGTEVAIRGNRRIEVGTILSYMQLPTDRTVTAEDLNAAVRRLFDTGLFKDVQIGQENGQMVVTVVENPSINEIAFEGNDLVTDETLQQVIRLKPRLPFTASGAEADAQAIIELYRRTGRYGAEVEPKIIERTDNRVDLVFEIKEGEITGVKSIDFVGNSHYTDRRLRGVIETSESGWLSWIISSDVYDPDRIELDKELLRQFYLSRGYADFTVLSATAELAPDRSGFFITFTVDEGEEYTFGKLDVSVSARGLDPEEFRALLPADLEGEVYDASRVEKIATELTDLAGQKGFAFVQVQPQPVKDAEARTVGINFELAEGNRIFVERIDIEGNVQTLDRVIRREVQLVEGDAYNTRKIRDSRTNIRKLGFFKTVEIQTEPGSADDRAVLKVKVQEQPTGSLSLGFGYSSAVGPVGNIAITERNFLGRGQTVQAQITAAGDTQIYSFSFIEPRFLDRDLSVGMRAFYVQDDRQSESSFDQNTSGFVPSVSFPLSEDLRMRLRYSLMYDDLRVAADASPAIQVDRGTRFTSSVGYTLSYDRRNDPIEPTRGYLTTFDQEVAGLGGSSRFVRTRGTAKGWYSFFDDQIVTSLEVEAGAIVSFDKDTRITERYFLGGETLRGFSYGGLGPRDLTTDDTLGGNYYSVARLETSFPLGLPEELGIYGGAFLDAGTVWGLDTTTFGPDTIDDSAHFRASTGALLFLDTPLGPLQLIFGVPLVKKSYDEKEFFRLSIGTRF